MNWIKSQLARLVAPSIIGQVLRGLAKVISGYLLTVGVTNVQAASFTEALIEVLSAVVLFLLAQKGSAVATDKALKTPAMPVIVRD